MQDPVECYLNVVVEKPKTPGPNHHHDIHSYAEKPVHAVEREENKENDGTMASPPSPPQTPDPYEDGPDWDCEYTPSSASKRHPSETRVTVNKMPPGRPSTKSRASSAHSGNRLGPDEMTLNLPSGELFRYLMDVRSKQQQISELQNNFNSLVEKVQFRNAHPDWSEAIPEQTLSSPLLTLRDGHLRRDPPLEKAELLSRDTLLPLAPNDAWYAVVALRKQILDLQVALMYSRVQVKYRELRLQEVTAEHRRYKASVRAKQRQAEKEEQNRDSRIRQLERRIDLASTNCSQWRLKTKMAEKTGNKKKKRSELLAKGLEQIFTPMQLRVIRTGKMARWTEEDIRRAIELKKVVTRRGYAFIRTKMKIPLPSPRMMKLGASRFESLKHVYEQMVKANLLKYSTKKKPKVVKKDDHAYEVNQQTLDVDQQELQVDMGVKSRKSRTKEASSEEPTSSEFVQPKPVRRRKKRPASQLPMDIEFEALGAAGPAFVPDSSAAVPKRPRSAWSETRPSWEVSRLWGGHDPALDEYEQTREERRQRPRPTWSADTADFL